MGFVHPRIKGNIERGLIMTCHMGLVPIDLVLGVNIYYFVLQDVSE